MSKNGELVSEDNSKEENAKESNEKSSKSGKNSS